MPRVVEYQSQTEVQGSGIGPSVDFGGILGDIGGQIRQASDRIQKDTERRETADVDLRVAQAVADYTIKLDELARTAQPGDATIAEKLNQDFAEYTAKLQEQTGYTTAAGQQAWKLGFGRLQQSLRVKGMDLQSDMAAAKVKLDHNATIDLYQNTLAHDPAQYDEVMATVDASFDNPDGPYSGLDADTREKLRADDKNKIGISAFQGLARQNPQEALRQLQAGEWDTRVDGDKMVALENRAITLIRAQELDLARAEAASRRAEAAQSKAAMDEYFGKLYADAPDETAKAIALDPRLDPSAKVTMLGVAERTTKPDPLAEVSHATSSRLFARLHLPDGDPNKITNEEVLSQEYVLGRLNRTDLDWLRKEFTNARTPEGDMLGKRTNDFLKAIEPQIDQKGIFGLPTDPRGGEQFYRYSDMVRRKAQEYRDAKKDPYALFDPASPDYLGKPETVSSFKIPLAQQMKNITQGLSMETPAAPVQETFNINGQDLPVQEKKTVNGIEYFKVDGQWYSK